MVFRAHAALAGFLLSAGPHAFALNPALDVSQYAHASWKIRDGFVKGAISSIAQTSDGYLWLGTDSGLYRFDGVRAVPWQPPPDQPLPSTAVKRLVAAHDGTLWIGTQAGLASWKNGKLTQYAELAGSLIMVLLEDREGSIWTSAFGLPHGKLCEIQKGSVRCYPQAGGLGDAFALHQDREGNLWVGLRTGVWQWKPGPPQFYALPIETNGIQGIVDSDDRGVLISTSGGIRRLVGGKSEPAFAVPASLRGSAAQMLRDRDQGLWVNTFGWGIRHIHQGRIDTFSQSDGLTGDYVGSVFEDREGNIWVTTLNGLDRFRELPVVTYSTNQGLAPAAVVLGARDGSVWLIAADGSLSRINHGQVTRYNQPGTSVRAGVRRITPGGLPDRGLASLFQDSRGRIWVSSQTEIGYLENERFIPVAAPGGPVTGMSEDSTGNLWISYEDRGLVRLSPRNEVQQMPWDTFGRTDPAYALPDPVRGGLWLGFTNGGLIYFRDGRIRASYSTADGLGSGRVTQLRFDTEGALWAATLGGLSRLKDGHIATLNSKDGLPCNAVHWTIEDAQSVWLGMPCGLVQVARSDLSAWAGAPGKPGPTIHPTVFETSDGALLPGGIGGYTPHAGKSSDGKVWFGVMDGIGVIDPRHLPTNKLPPPVHIEQITADRKTYDTASHPNPHLPPFVRDLVIDYTALSLAAPEKIQFRYRLEGHDPDWQDAGNRRQAFYTDLPPRHYRFRVAAANNSGVWNEEDTSLDFSIAPAYYQTTGFQVACAFAVFVLLGVLYRLRLIYLTQQFNMRLEERARERTRIARDLHDTLLQSFQGLMLHLQVVDDLLPEGKAKEQLERTLQRGDQAIAEGRSAVYDLRSSATITNDLADAVRAVGEELAAPDSATFGLVVEGPARDLHPIIRDELYRITREAIRNAFSHARAHHIETEITFGERVLRLRVRDDGEGIPSEILEEGLPGHYGLPGMRERAKQIGGKLDVWSGAGAGTEIELSIAGSIAYGTSTDRPLFRLFRKKGA